MPLESITSFATTIPVFSHKHGKPTMPPTEKITIPFYYIYTDPTNHHLSAYANNLIKTKMVIQQIRM